jgi:hypothetical protein
MTVAQLIDMDSLGADKPRDYIHGARAGAGYSPPTSKLQSNRDKAIRHGLAGRHPVILIRSGCRIKSGMTDLKFLRHRQSLFPCYYGGFAYYKRYEILYQTISRQPRRIWTGYSAQGQSVH